MVSLRKNDFKLDVVNRKTQAREGSGWIALE